MGAWGEGPFDNDDAADWAGEFEGAGRDTGLTTVRSALEAAAGADGEGYLDAYEGALAVAAAEVVAAINGLDVVESPYNEAALAWVATTQPPADPESVSLAIQALQRIAAPESELADLWAEVDNRSWRQSVDDRLARLRSLTQR